MSENNTSEHIQENNIILEDQIHPDVSEQIRTNKVGILEATFAPLRNITHFSHLVEDLHNTRAANDDNYNKDT